MFLIGSSAEPLAIIWLVPEQQPDRAVASATSVEVGGGVENPLARNSTGQPHQPPVAPRPGEPPPRQHAPAVPPMSPAASVAAERWRQAQHQVILNQRLELLNLARQVTAGALDDKALVGAMERSGGSRMVVVPQEAASQLHQDGGSSLSFPAATNDAGRPHVGSHNVELTGTLRAHAATPQMEHGIEHGQLSPGSSHDWSFSDDENET